MLVFAFLLALMVAVTAKVIDTSEQEQYPKNQIEFSRNLIEDPPRDLQLIKYLLRNELLSRQGNPFDWDEQQRKRSYWKQCAFNAVSCFGKK
ncbi:hypothetical protein RUM44_006248 [Polyplax serrata]